MTTKIPKGRGTHRGDPRPFDLATLMTHCRLSLGEVAERLETPVSTVVRWKRKGLTEDQAEAIAVSLGYLPFEIWGTDQERDTA